MITALRRAPTIPLTNLVPNGGFETDTAGWVGYYTDQQARQQNLALITQTLYTQHGEIGVRAAQHGTGTQGTVYMNLGTITGGGQGTQTDVPIPVTPGNLYYIRAQVSLWGVSTKSNSVTACTVLNDVSAPPSRTVLPTPMSDGLQLLQVPNTDPAWPLPMTLLDTIWTADTTELFLRFAWTLTGNSGNNELHGQVDNVVVIDLTEDFKDYGPGNEPPIFAIRQGVSHGVIHFPPGGHWSGTTDIEMPIPPEITTLSIFPALKGRNYTQQIDIDPETGTPDFIFTLDGLPQGHGLHVDPSGLISGVVGLEEGSYPFTLWVTDAIGYRVSQAYTLMVGEPPVILDEFLINPTVDEIYEYIPNVTGSQQNLTVTISGAGSLPSGLSIATDPVTGFDMIAGTPTAAGEYCQITVTARNDYDTVTKVFMLTVYLSPWINNTSPLPPATLNAPYSVEFYVSGKKPIVIEYLEDEYPPGLVFANGVLSGTPTQVGTYTFSIRATNDVEPPNPNTDTKVFTLTVSELPVITTTMFGYARLLTPYSGQLTATGTEPIRYSIISGSLPPGLSLDEEEGVISGMALGSGAFTFTVVATNLAGSSAPATFTINAGNAMAIITTSPLPEGTRGTAYAPIRFAAVGLDTALTPIETWSLDDTANFPPPPGLSLLSDGTFSGTPTTAGVFTIHVKVVNGPAATPFTIAPFIIEIGTPPVITTPPSLVGGVLRPFTVTLHASGRQPIEYFLHNAPPPPPPNISLDSETGALYWLIPEEGVYDFEVVATNVFGTSQPVHFTLTITTPSIIDRQEDLDIGVVGEAYSYTFSAGGQPPFTWALTGSLPDGMYFNAATATLYGTPTLVGATPFTLRVTNEGGFAEENFSLIVYERPRFVTTALQSGNVNASYSEPLYTSGTTPISIELVSGVLPGGLVLGATGITGSPTATGTFTFTLQASNILGVPYADVRLFTIIILPSNAPVITTPNNQRGVKGVFFTMTAEATGALPITFEVVDPLITPLPDGLTLEYDSGTDTYTIEGTPTVPGVHEFTLSATNSDGVDYRLFTLTVGDPPVITSVSPLPSGFTEVYYSEALAASGDTPLEWEVQTPVGGETGLPVGLALNRRTGGISGIPTAGGEFTFRVQAKNASGSDVRAFTLEIGLSGGTFINGDEIAYLFINGDEVDEAYVNGARII